MLYMYWSMLYHSADQHRHNQLKLTNCQKHLKIEVRMNATKLHPWRSILRGSHASGEPNDAKKTQRLESVSNPLDLLSEQFEGIIDLDSKCLTEMWSKSLKSWEDSPI